MQIQESFDRKAARASARELHHKAARRALDRRQALAAARTARTTGQPHDALYNAFHAARLAACERGACARAWGLIAGFLRGKAYRRLEARTAPGNAPSAYELATLALEVARDPTLRVERDAAPGTVAQRALRDDLRVELEAWLAEAPAASLSDAA
jgi:hypothetical protein